MHTIYSSSRSNSGSNSSNTSRNIRTTAKTDQGFKIETQTQDLIDKASTVPIHLIFKLYGLKVDGSTKKIPCPFSEFHKNGIDKSPSFTIYHDTNSFYCFGCGESGNGVKFVSIIEGVSRYKAAYKILNALENEVDLNNLQIYNIDRSETLNILMGFSNYIRDKITNNDNKEYLQFIDEVCMALDGLYEKYSPISNEALRVLIDRLKKKVDDYSK